MKKSLNIFYILFLLVFSMNAQTIDQDLNVVVNDGISNLSIEVRVSGTSLTPSSTLANATIDVNYDSGLLTFVDATNWGVDFFSGYVTSADDNGSYIRIIITGGGVGTAGAGVPAGLDITSTPTSLVQLNFTHSSPTSTTDLDIAPGSNAISVFNNPNNNPNTGATTPLSLTRTGLSAQPLPVELSTFNVNAVEGTKAQLEWETATEVNNYGFEIERSLVSENADAEAAWEKVAFVEGHGNSNSPKLYSFTDKNLVGGSKFMYRLKQIDIDGQFEYSDAVEIEVLPTKYELLQNYPNPFNPATAIKFSLPEDTKLAINIYNLLGERVATVLNEELKAGFHQVEFNTNSAGYTLASGVYIYTLESKNFSQVKKMILMK